MGAVVAKERVLLVEQEALVRRVLAWALEEQAGLAVVEASDAAGALRTAARSQPSQILLDGKIVASEGAAFIGDLKEAAGPASVIVLAARCCDDLLFDAVRAGASGYLTKEAPLATFIDAIDAVRRGEFPVPPGMLSPLIARLNARRKIHEEGASALARLTRQERRVLAILAQGGNNETMASVLFISPQTARTHVNNIMGKLDVHSRLEAAAYVMGHDLFEELEEGDRELV
jgi:two-component system NarL family response regulator